MRDSVGIRSSIGFGSSSFVSLIEITIFSRSHGVMCFSRPLLVQSRATVCRNSGRALGIVVAAIGDTAASSSSNSDSDAESRLEDSAGTGMSVAAAFGLSEHAARVGGMVERAFESGLQQKVSRFQSLQLRFSSRLPSSMACEVFENNDH